MKLTKLINQFCYMELIDQFSYRHKQNIQWQYQRTTSESHIVIISCVTDISLQQLVKLETS